MKYIIMILVILLFLKLVVFGKLVCGASQNIRDGFSPSTKPFEADWTMFNRNPFDDVDYQVPSFIVKQR